MITKTNHMQVELIEGVFFQKKQYTNTNKMYQWANICCKVLLKCTLCSYLGLYAYFVLEFKGIWSNLTCLFNTNKTRFGFINGICVICLMFFGVHCNCSALLWNLVKFLPSIDVRIDVDQLAIQLHHPIILCWI